jgi:two-component system, cell cycle response regulator
VLRHEKIDLVLLDILLPVVNGFSVLEEIKKHEETAGTQVLIVTSLTDMESRIRGIETGADDFLVKPFNRAELEARIRALLKKKEYLDKLQSDYRRAAESAISDPLTGLYNKAYLLNVLENEVNRVKRQFHQVSFIMLDLDDFKHWNDQYGHLKGDEILQAVGATVRRNIREIDVAARFGGEEFSVILPYANRQQAARCAERILEDIASEAFAKRLGLSGRQVTLSAGIAECPAQASSPLDLIGKADLALYQAKESGKNRVCVFADPDRREPGANSVGGEQDAR